MIATLAFVNPQRLPDGRVVRRPAFTPRSTLPISAACLVANGVREQLSRLLATELDVELVEPTVPGASERRVLVEGATVLRVRGRLCDGLIVIRPADARRLVALAFGEDGRSDGEPLSEIERATLERIAGGLVPLCTTLCGTLGPIVREANERAACDLTSYFEVRTTGAPRIAIGFAVTRDPAQTVGSRIAIANLADVELRGVVEFASGALGVPAFSRLGPGATLGLDASLGALGRLRIGEVTVARGTCGVRGERNAFAVSRTGA